MTHIYPGVSSISEHSALKACINQFQKTQVCGKWSRQMSWTMTIIQIYWIQNVTKMSRKEVIDNNKSIIC